jgi:ribonuclease J
MRHLVEHAKLARDCQVPVSVVVENGAVVRLAPGEPSIIDRVPAGRLGVDGNRLVPLDGAMLRDRQRLTHGGAATATLVLDRAGKFLAEPVVSAPGILDPEGDDAVGAAMRAALRSAVDQMPPGARRDDGAVREVARSALRRVFKSDLGRRPLTDIHLVRV